MSEPFETGMNLYITTKGRATGQSRPVHLWFAYADGLVYLFSLVFQDGRTTHWCQNLQRDRECVLAFDDSTYMGEVVSLEPDDALEARVRDMFREKYGQRPYDQWFGDDPMIPVVVRLGGEAPPGAAANPYADPE